MTTSFQILSSSVLTTSVIRLLRVRITDSLVKETADNWFGCVALQAAVSYNMLVKLAHFFPLNQTDVAVPTVFIIFRSLLVILQFFKANVRGMLENFHVLALCSVLSK